MDREVKTVFDPRVVALLLREAPGKDPIAIEMPQRYQQVEWK